MDVFAQGLDAAEGRPGLGALAYAHGRARAPVTGGDLPFPQATVTHSLSTRVTFPEATGHTGVPSGRFMSTRWWKENTSSPRSASSDRGSRTSSSVPEFPLPDGAL